MKILLIADVKDLGKAGEICKVADGYARNFLIPKGLGVLATEQNIAQASQQLKARQRKAEKEANAAQEQAKKLDGTEVRFQVRVGEQDRLYGSITTSDIAEQLAAQAGETIDRHHIELEEPIRELGIHQVTVKVGRGATARINVLVERG